MRVLGITLLVLLAICTLVAAGLWFGGRDLAVNAVLRLATDEYSVARIDGNLFGELRLGDLHLRAADTEVRLGEAVIDVAWLHLLEGRPGLDQLTLHAADVHLPASAPSAQLSMPELPALPRLFVTRLDLADIRIYSGPDPVEIKRIAGGISSQEHSLVFTQLQVQVANLEVSASGSLATAAGGSSNLDLALAYPEQDLQANVHLSGPLHAPAGLVGISAPLKASFGFALGFDPLPVLELDNGQLEVPGSTLVSGLNGRVELDGPQLRATGKLHASVPDLPPADLEFTASMLDYDTFDGNLDLLVEADQLHARLDGSIDRQQVNAAVNAELIDLRRWLAMAGVTAAVDIDVLPVTLALHASVADFSNPRIDVRDLQANFSWRNVPGELTGGAGWHGGLTQADATLTWAGRASHARFDAGRLTATIALADLGLLLPGTGAGTLTGNINAALDAAMQPRAVTLDLQASALAYGDVTASAASLDGHWQPGQPLDARLRVSNLVPYPDAMPYQVEFDANGSTAEFTWQAGLSGAELNLRASGRTALGNDLGNVKRVEVTLDTLVAELVGLDTLTLAAPTQVSYDFSSGASAQACLDSGHGAQLCVDISGQDYAVNARDINDRLWMPLLLTAVPDWPGRLALRGAIGADLRYAGDSGRLDANIDLTDAAILISDEAAGGEDTLAIETLGLTVSGQATGTRDLNATLKLNSAAFGNLSVTAALLGEDLSGQLLLDVPSLTPVALLVPELDDLQGVAQGSVDIAGTLAQPTFTAELTISGQTRIVPTGVQLRDVKLHVFGDSSQVLRIEGSSATGDGSITLNGTLEGLPDAPDVQLTVVGSDALLVNQPDLIAAVSPNLKLRWNAAGLRAGGRVEINRARVSLRPSLETSIVVSDDVVIHGDEPSAASMPLHADITVSLGKDARISAGPLDTAVSGTLRVTMEPGRPQRLVGTVAISNGEYTIYGVALNIERGRLDFAGPADNPAVQLRATRTIDTQEVGVNVSGFLQRLQTQVFSDPAQSEVDTLAMLVTGRSFAAASSGTGSSTDLNRISNAAASLGLGATGVVSRVRERVGLDELTLSDPLDRENSALMLGKQVTDRLYARYAYSLYNRTGGLQLRYLVLPNLSVQSEVGATQAVDFIFHRQFQ